MPTVEEIRKQLTPGTRVRVVQQIAARDYTWTTEVSGSIVKYGQRETGSWFAHSKDDKLWLDRLVLRKADGELTTLNLDENSHIEIEATPSQQAVANENADKVPV